LSDAGPVDWALAGRVAGRVAATLQRRPAGPNEFEQSSFQLDDVPVVDIANRIEAATGLRSALGDPTITLIGRDQWVRANIESFRHMLAPMLERMAEKMANKPGILTSATAKITGTEVGALLGWMSTRVLGQYDLLIGRDPNDDAVYLVEPNLASLEQRFGFDPTEFRTWVLTHELTHRAQFTGVPWMRDYFESLVTQMLSMADSDPKVLIDALRSAARDRDETLSLIKQHGLAGVIAGPEQRAVLDRIGGLMSLLEGHGDVVMSRAAAELVPNAVRFERILQQRRSKGNPLAKLIQRLTGIEAKLNQYAAGERFIAQIEAHGGPRLIDRCWRDPEFLPTIKEIREPQRWLDRVGDTPIADAG